MLATNDGTLIQYQATERASDQSRVVVDLALDLVAYQDDLFDRVLSTACDVLGYQVVELRVRPIAVGED